MSDRLVHVGPDGREYRWHRSTEADNRATADWLRAKPTEQSGIGAERAAKVARALSDIADLQAEFYGQVAQGG